jgi:DNA-binding transcriptional MerR regulator
VTLHELLDKAGLSARTLRHWTQKGLMPRPADGLYTDADLVRALAICRMRYEDGVRSLEEVAERLSAMSFEEMDRYVTIEDEAQGDEGEGIEAIPPVLPATDPPIASLDAPTPALDGSASPSRAATSPVPASIREAWAHIALRPGLVLLVRQPPSDEARSLARKIVTISDVDASFD